LDCGLMTVKSSDDFDCTSIWLSTFCPSSAL
jgi:hypothetical protein